MTALETEEATPLMGNRKNNIRRKASFSEVEKVCLRALLLDYPEHDNLSAAAEPIKTKQQLDTSHNSLDEAVLFQVPFSAPENRSTKFGRHEKKILGLWQAHEDGVHPVIMKRGRSASFLKGRSSSLLSSLTPNHRSIRSYDNPQAAYDHDDMDDSGHHSRTSSLTSAITARTDVEVRPPEDHDENSSWGDEEGGFVHYNAWEVLKDE